MSVLCRAKVNLTLHVGAPIQSGRWQGYHPVESLVAFADFGDQLTFSRSDKAHKLLIDGPFGDALSSAGDNLVLKALRLSNASPTAVRLTKNVPVSAGLGGGSANAAAVLRHFDPQGSVDAVQLGADVPVCRYSGTALMDGIGERLTPLPNLGRLAAVLVNPRRPVSTAEIFKAYDHQDPAILPKQTSQKGSLLDRTRTGRNDLQDIACQLEPVIADILSALDSLDGCQMARMSGSGATCFGVFNDMATARSHVAALAAHGWWVMPCWLGD